MTDLFDLFENSKDSKIVLFGSGRFAEYYMDIYGDYRRPLYMVDNNVDVHGCEKFGLTIKSPEVLRHANTGRLRIIVAIKDHEPILAQLSDMGIDPENIRVLKKDKPISPVFDMGYAMAIADDKIGEFCNPETAALSHYRKFARVCRRFVLGIPDDVIMGRLFTEARGYNSQILTQSLLQSEWIDDVVTLDYAGLRYPNIHKDLQFDACLYGSRYGDTFEKDCRYFNENGVAFISAVPERRLPRVDAVDTLDLALDDIHQTKKIVLFGTGLYAKKFLEEYPKCQPQYAIDSNSEREGELFGNLRIKSPATLSGEDADNTVLILCAKDTDEMIETIHRYGDFRYVTMVYRHEMSLLEMFGVAQEKEQAYIRDSHEILYKLVKEFTDVCHENNLRYYVICGSLIGVLRHEDMVPWDDDVDIAMPRSDYNKLRKITKKRWNTDTFKFIDYKSLGGGAFLDCMPRLFYMKAKFPTRVFKKVYGKAKADVADRMFLDIYVMDNAHPNTGLHNFCMGCMKGIYNLCMGHRSVRDYSEYEGYVSKGTMALMKTLNSIGSLFPIRFLTGMYELFGRSANLNSRADSYFMSACAITCIEKRFKKDFFGDGKPGKLHGMDVKVPDDPDSLFAAMGYGGLASIMNLPRYSIRKPSHYFNCDIEIWR